MTPARVTNGKIQNLPEMLRSLFENPSLRTKQCLGLKANQMRKIETHYKEVLEFRDQTVPFATLCLAILN